MKLHAKALVVAVFGMTGLSCLGATGVNREPMCPSLKAFVASVKKGETRTLEFHTSWGSGFKNSASTDKTVIAKRCVHSDYAPAEAVCDYLMQYGAIEFSGNNAKSAIVCLSPETRFSERMQLDKVDATFYYGSENRGSNINIMFAEDTKLGGMVLTVSADGY